MSLYPKTRPAARWAIWLGLGLILLLAAAFRTYQLAVLPGGLFPDEAANGLDINLMEQGVLEPFYERGNGREALFFYLLWASVKIFGRTPFAHHLISSLVGILAVLACFLVTKSLFSLSLRGGFKTNQSRKNHNEIASSPPQASAPRNDILILSLLSAFLLATSSWHVVLSRTAFRANLIPLLAALTLWSLLKIVNSKQESENKNYQVRTSGSGSLPTSHLSANLSVEALAKMEASAAADFSLLYSAAFGIFFALGFYTYIAFRIMVPLVAILILWPAAAHIYETWKQKKAHSDSPLRQEGGLGVRIWKPAIVAAISFAIFFAPLAHYFYTHPGSFVGRSGQVSVFNPELNGGDLVGTVAKVTVKSLTAYWANGDINWRHNISGFPFLSPYISPFFAIGLILCLIFAIRYLLFPIRYKHNYPQFLLVGWFAAMLIPVITTAEGIPHGLRAIGTIPAVFIITTYGMVAIYKWTKSRSPKFSTVLLTAYCILALLLPIQTYKLYFVRAASTPEYQFAFRADLTQVSEYLKQYGNRQTTYLILDKFSVQTVDYLTTMEGKTACDRNEHYRPQTCVDDPKNKPYTQVDPEESWRPYPPPPLEGSVGEGSGEPVLNPWKHGLKSGDEIVFTQSTIFDITKFLEYHPNAEFKLDVQNQFDQTILAVYTISD